jgi:hypothetical protein
MLVLLAQASVAQAQYHEIGYGEPYQLSGKRMVFTTWFWVKPGQTEWVNDEGKSVFVKRDVKALPGDPHVHWAGIDFPHGVRLVGEPAVKGQFPIKPEHPWEAEGIEITSLYQLPTEFNGRPAGTIMAWGTCKPGGSCYFESTDGVTWKRPKLGMVDFQGSKDNNLGGSGMFRGFLDPTAPPQERFKQINNVEWKPEEFEKSYKGRRPYSRMALEINPRVVQTAWGFTSPDGLNWKQEPEPLTVETCDGGQYVYYDRHLKKYVMIIRSHMIVPRAEGFPAQPKSDDAHEDYYKASIRFGIGRAESANFKEFPLSEPIIMPGNDMPPTDGFQYCVYTTIPHAPDHHVMFPTRWKRSSDSAEVDFYTSHDGKWWNKVLAPIIRPSNLGEWDGASVWTLNPGLVELGNGDWVIPFRGDLITTRYPRGLIASRWAAAIWPRGRLMAIEAEDEGRFATISVVAPGTKLAINALTKGPGQIQIEVADLRGKPIAGRTFDECIPIRGDQHRKRVQWKTADDLGVKVGEPVMFRFRMNQAKVYCLDFE